MSAKFTWHEKFTRAVEKLPDELVAPFVRAVLAYGTDGTEPDLAFPLDAIFETFREDIDYSKGVREANARGGRRSKSGGGTEGSEGATCKSPENTSKCCDDTCKSQENTSSPIQDIAIQDIAVQDKTEQKDKGGKRVRFRPPSPEEVEAYATERGTPIDAGRFCDFYASKGWKVGSQPMRDWRAAVRNWAARDAGKGAADGASAPAWLADYGG